MQHATVAGTVSYIQKRFPERYGSKSMLQAGYSALGLTCAISQVEQTETGSL